MTDAQSARLKKRFLLSFAVTGNITESAQATGIARRTVYNWQEQDDEFAEGFREAEIQSTELLEAEARRRAAVGVEKPVYHQGVVVGKIQEYSDTLLIFLLKARNPSKYRDNADLTAAILAHAQSIADRLGVPIDTVLRDAGVSVKV